MLTKGMHFLPLIKLGIRLVCSARASITLLFNWEWDYMFSKSQHLLPVNLGIIIGIQQGLLSHSRHIMHLWSGHLRQLLKKNDKLISQTWSQSDIEMISVWLLSCYVLAWLARLWEVTKDFSITIVLLCFRLVS